LSISCDKKISKDDLMHKFHETLLKEDDPAFDKLKEFIISMKGE
jgi:hypothetical protein